jgi:hypothetical protein
MANGIVMFADIASLNESKHISVFAGKDDISQRERLKDIGKSFFAAFGAFGYSFEFAELAGAEGDNQV